MVTSKYPSRPGADIDDQCHLLYYLPLLKLTEPVQINQLNLIPFPSKACDERIAEKYDWMKKRLCRLQQNYLNREGKPIETFTLVCGAEGAGIEVQDKATQALIYGFDLTLNLLNFRYRDYDKYLKSENQFFMECAALHPEKEDIYIPVSLWFHEAWTPVSSTSLITLIGDQTDLKFPLRRIREVFQAIQNSSDDLRKRISLALRFLTLSMQTTSQTAPQICLELMASAFEHLFEHANVQHTDSFAFKLEDLWTYPFRDYDYHPSPFKNKQLKQATQMQSFRLAKHPSSKKTWLQAWFLEFFKMRNDLLFNLPVNPKEYAWNLTQHLRVASEILPMTLLIILSRDDQTRLPLKNEDEKRIRQVDTFIQFARSIWYGAEFPADKKPDWLQGTVTPNLWDSVHAKK